MASSLHSGKYSVLLELLIKTRKSSGFTQQQVADKLGKPQSYIAYIVSFDIKSPSYVTDL